MKQEPLQIHVRMALAKDASAVAVVLERAFNEYREFYTFGAFVATVLTEDKVVTRMTEGPMWVALDSGEIVGSVAAVSQGVDLYVRSMGIVPAARGKQIGELLLKSVETYAIGHGHHRMTLSTTPFLSRAIRLYERFGFQRSEGGPADLFGTPLFSMTKKLSSSD